jgi:hypothetical protein
VTGAGRPTSAARLAADVGGDLAPELGDELEAWIASSGRFRAFVEANRPKIRRKLREAADPETVRDTRAELLVAARLLADRRIELAFEAYGARAAGPDFTVTFRGVTRFNVEVTRRRGAADGQAVADAVVTKLRQLPPSIANVLVVAADRPVAEADIAGSIHALRARVDARDPATLARAGATSPRDFYDRFLRLNAVVVWAEDAPGPDRVVAWQDPSARIALERKALFAVVGSLNGTPAG